MGTFIIFFQARKTGYNFRKVARWAPRYPYLQFFAVNLSLFLKYRKALEKQFSNIPLSSSDLHFCLNMVRALWALFMSVSETSRGLPPRLFMVWKNSPFIFFQITAPIPLAKISPGKSRKSVLCAVLRGILRVISLQPTAAASWEENPRGRALQWQLHHPHPSYLLNY